MFIWDFVADKILGQIVDWFYGQVVGFLGNFFSEMGSMGAELFEMNWVQSVVLFFSYLGWALFATGLVVAVFECGIEYSAGRGNVKETALNVLKGFLAVSLFTQVPVRLYSLAISVQGTLTAGITGFGSTSIGDAAKAALADLENLESLTESTYPLRGFGRETSGLMVLFCLILMAYAVIKVFFSNLKRGGILLIQIAVGSLYMFSVPRGYGDGFIQWCKQVIGLCLTAFLQATILVAGLMVFKDHALLGLGLMLSAGEIPRIAGAFGLDTTTKANLTSAVYTAQSAVNIARTVAAQCGALIWTACFTALAAFRWRLYTTVSSPYGPARSSRFPFESRSSGCWGSKWAHMFVKLVRYAASALLFSLDLSIAYAPQLGYALLASGETERSRLWKKRRTSAHPSRCHCTSGFVQSRSSGARPCPTTSRTYSKNILKEEHEP